MEKNQEKRALPFFGIGKILPYLKKYRKVMVTMIVCGLLSTGVDLLIPQFQRYSLNHFIANKTLDTLPWFLLVYVLAIIGTGIFNYASCKRAMSTEVEVNRDLRNAAFSHLQTLSFSYFNQNSVGYIHSRLISDTSRIGVLLSWIMVDFIWRGAYLVGAVVMMLVLNWRLAVLVLMVMPVFVLLFSLFQNRLESVNRDIREINAQITSDFNEGIMGAKTIKSLSIEEKMESRFLSHTAKMRKTTVRAARLRGLFSGTMSMATGVTLAILLWKGGYIAATEIGTFSVFMSYAQGMMEPLRGLVDLVSELITTQVNIERFTNLLAVQSDVVDTPEVVERYGDTFEPKQENWEELSGDIEFRDVTFRYPDGEETVLEHFSLKIPFGTHLAIVGETGAGKSTLVNLVCRFYEPTRGQILIDGRDVRERSQLWLHSAIGYVLQTPHLFSGTVRENLLMGNPNASDEQLMEAIRMVSAEDVIAHLEKGLDTDVGEGGDLLSTGEKQLISFARAILADPRILILDEATASIDTMTEARIQSAMERMISGRTCLMIAHRLSTVRNADLILAVRDGKIVEQGTHAQLLERRGYYYELYTRQNEEETTARILG